MCCFYNRKLKNGVFSNVVNRLIGSWIGGMMCCVVRFVISIRIVFISVEVGISWVWVWLISCRVRCGVVRLIKFISFVVVIVVFVSDV